jgi:Kef-type K+ transport system membrane component KefB
MIIDRNAIIHFWPWILGLAVIIFVGQTYVGIAYLFPIGKKSETAFKATFSKAQIGEFAREIENSLSKTHLLC